MIEHVLAMFPVENAGREGEYTRVKETSSICFRIAAEVSQSDDKVESVTSDNNVWEVDDQLKQQQSNKSRCGKHSSRKKISNVYENISNGYQPMFLFR